MSKLIYITSKNKSVILTDTTPDGKTKLFLINSIMT